MQLNTQLFAFIKGRLLAPRVTTGFEEIQKVNEV